MDDASQAWEVEHYLSILLKWWDIALPEIWAHLLAHDKEMRKEYLRHKDLVVEDMRQILWPRSRVLVLTCHTMDLI